MRLRRRLLAEMTADGHWEGRLSSSALAGAIAIFALAKVDTHEHREKIALGLDWIASHANDDGGWGDSPESPSNITATVLCWVALVWLAEERHADAIAAAEEWLRAAAGGIDPQDIRRAILARYGDDRTFAAPILTMCALSGRFGSEPEVWDMVPQLPFELSVLPHRIFGWLRMTVVSYALPALIAIGYVRHIRVPSRSAFRRLLRKLATRRALRIAERMQPENGGYEEATPLTGFVTMSLAAAGERDCLTVERGVDFLLTSMREDGSWPIDTNLATWVTTLAVKAIRSDATDETGLTSEQRATIREWLFGQQHEKQHPLTYGAPGGWAWSDLIGAMPDADDTPGALLALRRLGEIDDTARAAAAKAVKWLLDLRNRDGGTPTFARGWGKLPFDRSCPDVTAHTMWALDEWYADLPWRLRGAVRKNQRKNLRYLEKAQRADGSWVPLWFGNQWMENQEGPVYGTARVVAYLRGLGRSAGERVDMMIARGCKYLIQARNADGGWGGTLEKSSIEETALAVKALMPDGLTDVVLRGMAWVAARVDTADELPAAPIGLYFAKLWYSERLYPLLFALDAVEELAATPPE